MSQTKLPAFTSGTAAGIDSSYFSVLSPCGGGAA